MAIIKSYEVGDGDMFYIEHGTDNFSIIDCNLVEGRRDEILDEVSRIDSRKTITRFISTHPDEDHINGLVDLDDRIRILNFYRVDNSATKAEETASFVRYKSLRDDAKKSFKLEKGCSRKWMNRSDSKRGCSGIDILWPDCSNDDYRKALLVAAEGGNCNNISPIIQYRLKGGVTALWMGDLETEFMGRIESHIDLPKADLLFAPHHGRKSGRPPRSWLDHIDPSVIIVGSAPSEDLEYYRGYDTITQNSAGDILLDCRVGKVDVFVSNDSYSVGFLSQDAGASREGFKYLGTLSTRTR